MFFFLFFFPSAALFTVSKELACCSTVRLCNSIKILTALQPYLTLKLWSSKLYNKWLGIGIKVGFGMQLCVCGVSVCVNVYVCCVCECVCACSNPQDQIASHVY